jgi:hypothetical protein
MVPWTEDVPDSDFVQGDVALKHRNAEIANLLRARVGKRGWEYTWAFQLFSIVVYGIAPAIIMEGLGAWLMYWTIGAFGFGAKLTNRQLCEQGPAMVFHAHTRKDGWWSYSYFHIPPTVDERFGASIGYRLGNISGPGRADNHLGSFTHLHNSGLCRRCLGLTGRAAHLRYHGLCCPC